MKSTTFSADTLLSLATIPLLAGVVGAKIVSEMMQGIGQASEEVFRGDRLPVLKVTPTSDTPDTAS